MKRHLLALSVLACALNASAIADWKLAPDAGWLGDNASAHGLADTGYHNIHVTCTDEEPMIYTNGYPAVSGSARLSRFELVIDGTHFVVFGEHAPSDGLWSGPVNSDLVAALTQGKIATVTTEGQPVVSYSLKGARDAIESALKSCLPAADGTSKPVQMRMLIAQACAGEYSLDPGTEMTGLIDNDDFPDSVIFWGGVRCKNPERGRGYFCGAANCQVSVLLTQTPQTQDLLAPKVEVHRIASGRSELRTYGCRTGQNDCPTVWRWNGKRMEPK